MSIFELLSLFVLIYIIWIVYDWWRRKQWVDGLHNKAVLITGCDSGFGYATAKSLYARGVHVYAGCFTESGANKLQQETGDRLRTIILDVTDTESVRKAYKYVTDTLPKGTVFWGIVNNAGIGGIAAPVEFYTKNDVRSVIEVNVLGMIEVTNVFLPLLKKSKGRVVNMASIAAEIPMPNMMPYCISKHAAKGYSETLRLEKVMWGIKVSTIEPAFYKTNIINTEHYATQLNTKWNELDPHIQEEYGEEYVAQCIKIISDINNKGAVTSLDQVVFDYEHALFSIHPYNSYYPGFQAKTMMMIKQSIIGAPVLEKLVAMASVKPKILTK